MIFFYLLLLVIFSGLMEKAGLPIGTPWWYVSVAAFTASFLYVLSRFCKIQFP